MLDIGVKFLKMMIIEGACPDQWTFNMLITMYSERGDMSTAFDLLNIMKSIGLLPNDDTFSSIFNGLKRISLFQESHIFLHKMLENGFVPTERQYSSLVTSMCKSGDFRGALKLKDEMEGIGISSRCAAESAMVRGLVQRGKTEEGFLLLNCMLRSQLVPTNPTFTTVIHGLCKESKLSEALNCKLLMERHGAKPDVVAYNVLITGLCRTGDTARAFTLYEEMKQRGICPNTTTFSVLVNAICSENNSVNGESILVDLEDRGLVSQNSTGQDWHRRLSDAMALDLFVYAGFWICYRAPIGYDCMLNSVSVYCGSVSGNFDSCESTTWISTRTQFLDPKEYQELGSWLRVDYWLFFLWEFRTKKQVANYWSWLCFDLKYNFEWILTFSRSSSFIFLVAKDNDLATHTELMRIGSCLGRFVSTPFREWVLELWSQQDLLGVFFYELCFIFLNLLPDKFRSKDDFVQKHKNVSSFNGEEFRHELSTIWLTAAKVYISRLGMEELLKHIQNLKDLYASGVKHWNDSAEVPYQNSKLALSRLRDSN
ncbi:hypothetical protein Sango_2712400 [Sesamum angolense]|uniref:Pentatricopeptide repeat-containing protein n=1 Tax=Sesamum angolense TaxID=2727404 RepID=A0AAE1W3E5_9LAMI|nr:hypothetical protein Sango_2712400 [Sesamum angolense]